MIRVFNQYISPKALMLMLVEGGLIALALVCAVRIRFWNSAAGFGEYIVLPDFLWQALVFVATLQVCFYYCDLYNLNAIRDRSEQWIAVGQSIGSGCLLLGLVYFIFPGLLLGRGIFFISVVLVPVFIGSSRVVLDHIWQSAALKEKVVIFGSGDLAQTVGREFLKRNDLNISLVGFVGPASAAGEKSLLSRPVFGRQGESLNEIVAENEISRIVVALDDRRNALPTRDLVRLRVAGIRVEDANTTISALTGRVWLETVKPSWFVFSDGFRRSAIVLILKRVLDLVAAVVGLAVSLPVMLLVSLAIRLDSKGPVIYRQKRVGLRGKHFEVLKFRSMRTDAERNGAQWAAAKDPRVTRIGGFLRKYRLDELPQFINVIRGEMSLVGPRPERPEFVEELRKQISYYDERHSVRPGLTGWAQVQYQYGSSVEDAVRKLEYDLFYLKNMSILFDCVVLLNTVRIVFTGHGSR
jgi:sugar transferase (PEP-CTERM system associated)